MACSSTARFHQGSSSSAAFARVSVTPKPAQRTLQSRMRGPSAVWKARTVSARRSAGTSPCSLATCKPLASSRRARAASSRTKWLKTTTLPSACRRAAQSSAQASLALGGGAAGAPPPRASPRASAPPSGSASTSSARQGWRHVGQWRCPLPSQSRRQERWKRWAQAVAQGSCDIRSSRQIGHSAPSLPPMASASTTCCSRRFCRCWSMRASAASSSPPVPEPSDRRLLSSSRGRSSGAQQSWRRCVRSARTLATWLPTSPRSCRPCTRWAACLKKRS
mmetsp:Transcript_33258/g.95662  ORF Transcript_33258/g.95662 Transcript_33258/m.95662 type:complete len:278 (-) Transcript_33258:1926-2759(-)